jgi:hypothetical protein
MEKPFSGKVSSRDRCSDVYQMDIIKLLTAIRNERERLNAAIMAIERLTKVKEGSEMSIRKRGRPPGTKNKPKASVPQH